MSLPSWLGPRNGKLRGNDIHGWIPVGVRKEADTWRRLEGGARPGQAGLGAEQGRGREAVSQSSFISLLLFHLVMELSCVSPCHQGGKILL